MFPLTLMLFICQFAGNGGFTQLRPALIANSDLNEQAKTQPTCANLISMTNAELANYLRDLRDFLIIAGYEESHATRYTQIARTIEKMPESAELMMREGRLTEIPQVGKLIAQYIREFMLDGKSSKQIEWENEAPWSVVTMTRVPGLGAKTARRFFQEVGAKSLDELKAAAAAGKLDQMVGIGPKMRAAILDF